MSAVPVAGVETLEEYGAATAACTRCRLAQGRTQVVFGAGNPRADLMFVGEAPGFHEDKQGVPFVGQAGKLLEGLLAGIELRREDVYIANVLKCRPPGNRDPQPDEIEACEPHLFRQIEPTLPAVEVIIDQHDVGRSFPLLEPPYRRFAIADGHRLASPARQQSFDPG